MPARTFASAVARSGGVRDLYRDPAGVLRSIRVSADHLEVFIPGKVS